MIAETPPHFRDFIATCATRFGDRTALIEHHGEDRRSLSYRQLNEEIQRVSSHLLKIGIKRQERIAICSENRLEWLVFALATLQVGATLVPLDNNLDADSLARLIRRAKVKALGVSRTYLEIALKIGSSWEEPFSIVCFDEAPADHRVSAWADCRGSSASGNSKLPKVSPDDVALLVFTSGTTSDPKGVALSHRNVLSSGWWTCRHTEVLFPESRVFFAIPLFHMYTFTVGLLAPFMIGACAVLGSSLKPLRFQAELRACKASLMIAVPLIYEGILQSIAARLAEKPALVRWLLGLHASLVDGGNSRLLLPLSRRLYAAVHEAFGGTLKFLVSGGAPLKPAVAAGLERLGFVVVQGYGMTEVGPVIASESASQGRLGSVGRPLAHLQVRIARPDANGIGEVQVRGDGVMKGYDQAPAMNRESFEAGWLRTGDLGFLDRQGFLFICGRHKDLIVTSGGKKIHPEELEGCYLRSPLIKEICIQQVGGKNGNDCLHATIVPNVEANASPLSDSEWTKLIQDELRRISKDLPGYQRIDTFLLSHEELPKTTLRKLRRHLISQNFSESRQLALPVFGK